MIFLASLCLFLSLFLGWRGLFRNTRGEPRRVLRLIFASGLFFSSLFFLVHQLHAGHYIDILREPWLGVLSAPSSTLRLSPNQKTSLSIRVENQGTEAFVSTLPEKPVFLSYHILSSKGEMLRFDNPRFAFGEPLEPKQEETVVAILDNRTLELSPGEYLVEFDLVREGAFWFARHSRGARTLRIPLRVRGEAP